MKLSLLIFSLIVSMYCHCQETLYLVVPSLGSEKFIFYEGGDFTYQSSLCGSEFVSVGRYKQTFFGYRFEYDTTNCPTPSVIKKEGSHSSDSICFSFYNMVDSSKSFYHDTISVGGITQFCDSSFLKISRHHLINDTLILNTYKNKHIITFDTSGSHFNIYIEPQVISYSCGINDIYKLRKAKHGYLYKKIVFDEIRDKPWKKGKRRVVRQYFKKVKR